MFCPKCHNEYRPGIMKCADCKCDLVEELTEEKVPLTFSNFEDPLKVLAEFLESHKINGVEIRRNDKEGVFEIFVAKKDYDKAQRVIELYMMSLNKEKNKAKAEEEQAKEEAAAAPVHYYQDNDTRARENKSSAVVLLVVGILGMIFILLGISGILPIRLNGTSKYMTYGTMSALFLIFIIMGLISAKSYKVFLKKAESDNTLSESLHKWVEENLDKKKVDDTVLAFDTDLPSEEKYFRRAEYMKAKIKEQFMNLDEQFLERFVDDIYSDMFENE